MEFQQKRLFSNSKRKKNIGGKNWLDFIACLSSQNCIFAVNLRHKNRFKWLFFESKVALKTLLLISHLCICQICFNLYSHSFTKTKMSVKKSLKNLQIRDRKQTGKKQKLSDQEIILQINILFLTIKSFYTVSSLIFLVFSFRVKPVFVFTTEFNVKAAILFFSTRGIWADSLVVE